MRGSQVMHVFPFHYPKFIFHIKIPYNTQITRDIWMSALFTSDVQRVSLMGNACILITIVFWVLCGVCNIDYTFGIADSNSVHHLCIMYASWCLYYLEYYVVCVYGHIHSEYWTPRAHITSKPCMHPGVCCSLNRVCMCNVYLALWTRTVWITCEACMHALRCP